MVWIRIRRRAVTPDPQTIIWRGRNVGIRPRMMMMLVNWRRACAKPTVWKKKEIQFEKKLNINKLLKWRTRSKREKSHWSWKYLHDSACSVKDVRTKVRLISNFFRLIIANKEHLKQYTHFFVKENRASALQFDTWPDRLGVNRPRCSIIRTSQILDCSKSRETTSMSAALTTIDNLLIRALNRKLQRDALIGDTVCSQRATHNIRLSKFQVYNSQTSLKITNQFVVK